MKRLVFFLFLFTSIAKAQVTDSFTDGNFTAAPVWSGDAAEFIVNTTPELQLNNTVGGASFLSTASPGSSIDNTQWSFYIKQTFSPSGSNYGRVYLVSDQANLEGSLNGYYLQFGEALSLDAVELFRQTGMTSTSVCRGVDGEISASFAIGVKVTRDAAGNWSLYVDPAGGTAYNLEDTGTDLTHTTTSFFGVACVYTVSSATKFFFDDFYNGAIIVDLTPPSIVSSTVISNTQLDVLFNESVDLATSQIITNYSADNGLGNPSSAVRDGSNLALVHLTFATAFTDGLLNTLTVTNVQDLSANAITTDNTTFTYFAPVVATFRDIIINEIMADPTPVVAMPAVEFVEIFNKSTNTFNLSGWQFSSGTSTATLGSYILGPGQYLVLCANTDTALFPGVNKLGLSTLPGLTNSGSNLKLRDNTLAVVDSVYYNLSFYEDGIKEDGGWTLELINPNFPITCPPKANWIASNDPDGGTPGFVNSVYSAVADLTAPSVASVTVIDPTHIVLCYTEAVDAAQIGVLTNYSINSGIGTPTSDTVSVNLACVELVLGTALTPSSTYIITISNMSDCAGNALSPTTATFSYYIPVQYDVTVNEIMADPDPVVGSLPDAEYIELYNKTVYPINLNNWTITVGSNTKLLPNVIIQADSFLVLTSSAALPLFPAGIDIAAVSGFPAITNTGQNITLKNASGAAISSVSFSDHWYQDDVKLLGGWSLEQIDPNNPCGGMNNWRASNNTNGGTPGTQNSIYGTNPDNTVPEVVRVNVIAIDTIQLYFNEALDSTTMLSPSLYTIDNSIGNPTSVTVIAPDFKSVRLVLGTNLVNGIIYTITVNNSITDCVGNSIGADNSARFAIPEPALPNDIVINEIMYDPKTDGVDWVEIYNRSTKVIDLKTITISEYDTVLNVITGPEIITPDGYQLFSGEYLVLSTNGNAIKAQYATSNPEAFLDVLDLPAMNNDGGTVCLSTATTIIDNFTYYEEMQFALLDVTKGVSLERIDFERGTQEFTNWHSASLQVGYATPGFKNSQYNDAGETSDAIEITPNVFSPDEDGMNDVVNINYHFDAPGFVANVMIYDSKGRMIKHLIKSELLGINGTFSWDGIDEEREKARIGIYIFYIEVFDLSGTVKKFKKTCVLASKL